MSENSAEEWRPIPGFPGYEASDIGRIRSVERDVTGSNGLTRHLRGRVLRQVPAPTKSGGNRPTVNMSRKLKRVGPMVARAFYGMPLDGQVLRHLNDDPWDNRIENLRWGTVSENTQDAIRNGRNHGLNKTHCKLKHPLSGGNLVKGTNQRACRACNDSRPVWARYPDLDRQQIADDFYARNNGLPESRLLLSVRAISNQRRNAWAAASGEDDRGVRAAHDAQQAQNPQQEQHGRYDQQHDADNP